MSLLEILGWPNTQLLKERDIQNVKILFCKLKKSFTTACGKTLLPKLADFHEDGTKLLICVVQNTQSTTSAAMRNAQADLNKLSFKEVRFDIDRLHARFDDLVSTLKAGQSELSMSQQLMKNRICNFLRELPHRMAFQIANHYFLIYD